MSEESDNEPIMIKQKTLNKFKILMAEEEQEDTPAYKLYYFDVYGRGEAIRMLLTHANVPYEEERI